MSQIRFNHVFLSFLSASAVMAFVVPPRYANRVRGHLDGLFAPVSYPVRKVAAALSRQITAASERSEPAPADANRQIEQLKARVAGFEVQFIEYERLNKSRDLLGEAERYSKPFKVVGADDAMRDMILLQGSSGDGIQVGMEVLSSNMVVGRVAAVGASGAQVRLITDRGFAVEGAIGQVLPGKDGKPKLRIKETNKPIIEGRGGGVMKITNLTAREVADANLAPGDCVYLHDTEWPLVVQGFLLGEIEKIDTSSKSMLFMEITVKPTVAPTQVREVMVLMQDSKEVSAPLSVAASRTAPAGRKGSAAKR